MARIRQSYTYKKLTATKPTAKFTITTSYKSYKQVVNGQTVSSKYSYSRRISAASPKLQY